MKMQAKKVSKNIMELTHLASFAELNPDPVLEIDMSGNIIYANSAVLKLFSDYKDIDFQSYYLKDIPTIAKQLIKKRIRSSHREISIGQLYHLQMIHYFKETGWIRIFGYDISERKQKDEKLKESETILKIISTTSPVCIVLIGPDRITRWTSENMSSLNGYSPEEMHGRGSRFIYRTDEEFERVGEVVFGEVKRGGIGSTDTQWIHKNGRILDIHIIAAAIDSKDLSAGIILTAINITKSKEAERDLHESEVRFRTVVENSNDGIALIKEGVHIYVNQKFLNIFGYEKQEEVLGKTPYSLIHPDDHAKMKEYVENNKKHLYSNPTYVEHRSVKKDGTLILIEDLSTEIMYNGEHIIIAFLRDITERKAIEAEVRESRDQLQKIVDNSPIAMSLADRQRNIIYNNNKFIELFGYGVDDMPTIDDWRRLAYPDKEYRESLSIRIADLTARLKRGEKIPPLEGKIICKDGSARYVEVVTVTLPNRYLSNFIDLTERKKMEEELLASREQLQKIVEGTPVAISLADKNGKIIYNNNMFVELFGYTINEIPTVDEWRSLAYPDKEYRELVRSRIADNVAKPKNKGFIGSLDVKITCKDGSIRDVEMSAVFVTNYVLVSYVDLTECNP
jgi:PAS domain S-box-containing protein